MDVAYEKLDAALSWNDASHLSRTVREATMLVPSGRAAVFAQSGGSVLVPVQLIVRACPRQVIARQCPIR